MTSSWNTLPVRRAVAGALVLGGLLAHQVARAADADEVELEIGADAPSPEPPPSDSLTSPPTNQESEGLPVPLPADPAPVVPEPPPIAWFDALDLRVSGYVQAQVEHHQDSEDELSPDGRTLNLDRFLVRRGRLRVDRWWTYAHAAFELDASTTRGPFLSIRRAEATLSVPRDRSRAPGPDELPVAALTAGLSEIPFGYELTWGNRERPWMERTTGSLAFFRGEPDVGVRAWGGVGAVRYAVAALNGVPLDDRPGAATDVLVARKTVVGRLGLASDGEHHDVGVGVSALEGGGLHPGTPESKSGLSWRDVNQDGIVTLNELVAEPPQAATASTPFRRWGVNADLEAGVRTGLGWTRVFGEVTLAQNLDRGLFVADPVSVGYDLRELAWTVSALQDLGPWVWLGVRADVYDPDADAFEQRRGAFEPLESSLTTLSPLAALRLPHGARLAVQYDWIADHLGRDSRGVPVDLPNDFVTARLQAEF